MGTPGLHGQEGDDVSSELLTALYALAPKCEACRKHVATRVGHHPSVGMWRICDRERCSARDWRARVWVDLPHAVALRAANADHEAQS